MNMNKAGRTVVRDPRKKAVPAVRRDDVPAEPPHATAPHNYNPIQPSQPGLGSYMLMGAGMALGFALVGALFGGF
jgi:hypothetical protein